MNNAILASYSLLKKLLLCKTAPATREVEAKQHCLISSPKRGKKNHVHIEKDFRKPSNQAFAPRPQKLLVHRNQQPEER